MGTRPGGTPQLHWRPMAPMGPLRLAWQQASLQVVFEVGTGQCGQMASVSTDLMTWGTGRGREAGLQLWAHAIPN